MHAKWNPIKLCNNFAYGNYQWYCSKESWKKTVLRQTGEAFVLLFCHDLWLNSNSNKKNYQFWPSLFDKRFANFWWHKSFHLLGLLSRLLDPPTLWGKRWKKPQEKPKSQFALIRCNFTITLLRYYSTVGSGIVITLENTDYYPMTSIFTFPTDVWLEVLHSRWAFISIFFSLSWLIEPLLRSREGRAMLGIKVTHHNPWAT